MDIVSEYPSEVEHMFSPSCVSLLRCTGCCGDENLHCAPVETVNVTMQVGRVPSSCPGLLRGPPSEGRRAAQGHRTGTDSSTVPSFLSPRPGFEPTHLLPYQLTQALA